MYVHFFRYDGQKTDSTNLNTTANYRAINWTPLRAAALADFYDEAPLEMQCQSGGGMSTTIYSLHNKESIKMTLYLRIGIAWKVDKYV